MTIKNTTPVPNSFFEKIPTLTHAEIRVILVIIRQTYGWKDVKTNQRKIRDRITHSFFIKKTGLYRAIITKTINSLIEKDSIIVTDYSGSVLKTAQARKGKHFLFYQFKPVCIPALASMQTDTTPVRNRIHNKTKTLKRNSEQKEPTTLSELIEQLTKANRYGK